MKKSGNFGRNQLNASSSFGQSNERNKKRSNPERDKELSSTQKFKKASLENKQRAKEILKSFDDVYESSSDEDSIDDVGIINNLTKTYSASNHVRDDIKNHTEKENLGITAQYLIESCQSGAITCLVCISKIKRQNEIWSCLNCYGIFHLKCIKQWVYEGVVQTSILSDDLFPNRDQPWHCPKCRKEYSRSDCPASYFCFCGSVKDPISDPWLIPHSCGGICNKALDNQKCGHRCLLLCHPGPCPPCPQMVKLSCHCGKKPPVSRRCGTGPWSCGEKCGKLLKCKQHRCQEICHEGSCTMCTQTSLQPCICGSHTKKLPCINPEWTCETPCGRLLDCGFHSCEKICHKSGDCGKCPTSGIRTCPCGKEKYEGLTCKDNVSTCEDTCGKVLGCYGKHKCSRKCHFGDCGPCSLSIRKHCRCRRSKREMPCHKEFSCDIRCTKTKLCGKHQCRRKCCVGKCPPCDQPCNKPLQCKRHKCQMLCHHGPCYPCPVTTRVSCRCGKTEINVICGKQSKPPRCRFPCSIPPNCHHVTQISHPCHFGSCPECKQVCKNKLPCDHSCPISCHDNVVIKNEFKPTAPWERPKKLIEIKALDCPPCKSPVLVDCRGKHERAEFPCCEAKPYSCGRICGRKLACGNHVCERQCHVVTNAKTEESAGSKCATCEKPCSKPRPPGCQHQCISACHPDDCPPCRKPIKMKCHCGVVLLKYLCCEWLEKSVDEQERMRSCGSTCPKQLTTCGHYCPIQCHPGSCPPSSECRKKVSLRCPCKRKKQDFFCCDVQAHKVVCDSKCEELKARKEAEKVTEEKKKHENELKRQRAEIEKFDRWKDKTSRRGKRRRSVEEIVKPPGLLSRLTGSSSTFVIVLGIFGAGCALIVMYLTKV